MYATRTRTRKFGTNDQRDVFAAKYGSADYETVGRAIAAAQPIRQEATVTDPEFVYDWHPQGPNDGTVETLHELAASRTPWIAKERVEKFARTNSAEIVAARIDWLEAQPVWREARDTNQPLRKRTPQPTGQNLPKVDVPEGRYAVTGEDGATKFYRVDRPTEGRWKGYVFVKVQASDELHNVRSREARNSILAKIAADGIQEAMLRYGREIGKCGHCGRTLTNEESRAVGIGPVCRGKMGW
jgi:hypothetical protein